MSPASALAMLGRSDPAVRRLRWSNLDLARVAALTLAVIIFQALLGMWTVSTEGQADMALLVYSGIVAP